MPSTDPVPPTAGSGAPPAAAESVAPVVVKSAYEQLPKKHKRFVDAYVQCGIGTQAMRMIGFKGKAPEVAASRLKAMPQIAAAIEERDQLAADNAGITRTRIYLELRHVATFDHRRLYDRRGKPLPIHKLPEEVAAGLAGTEVEELFEFEGQKRIAKGRIHKYRSWPKVEALKTLAQMRRMMPQQHELTGKNGGPIKTQAVTNADDLTDEQLEAIARTGRPAPPEPEESED